MWSNLIHKCCNSFYLIYKRVTTLLKFKYYKKNKNTKSCLCLENDIFYVFITTKYRNYCYVQEKSGITVYTRKVEFSYCEFTNKCVYINFDRLRSASTPQISIHWLHYLKSQFVIRVFSNQHPFQILRSMG